MAIENSVKNPNDLYSQFISRHLQVPNNAQTNTVSVKPNEPLEKDTFTILGKEVNKKKAITASIIAAAAAITGVILLLKNKNVLKLQDITFKDAIALKGDKKFSGIIEDTLKGGDKIRLEYKNGIIQNSVRTGETNFSKTYTHNSDGKITSVITKAQNTVKEFIANDNGSNVFKENDKIIKTAPAYKEILDDFDKTLRKLNINRKSGPTLDYSRIFSSGKID